MSWLAWFWLFLIVLLTGAGIRCLWRMGAMLDDWTVMASKFTKSMEGGNAADRTND